MALTKTQVAMLEATGTPSSGNFLRGDGAWSNVGVSQLSATGTPSSSTFLRGDGSWNAPASGITLMTAQNSTSGTFIDFTSIPTGVRRISVMFRGVSTNGASLHQLQLGSGSIQTTGYTVNATQDASSANHTSGFVFINNAAGDVCDGIITFTNFNGNIWIGSGFQGRIGGGVGTRNTIGSVSLSGVLDRLRYTTVNGTDAFDAGSINVLYER
jgi:hypothetical protein